MCSSLSMVFDPQKQDMQNTLINHSQNFTNNRPNAEQSEEDRIKAMFEQTTEHWEKTQEQMATYVI